MKGVVSKIFKKVVSLLKDNSGMVSPFQILVCFVVISVMAYFFASGIQKRFSIVTIVEEISTSFPWVLAILGGLFLLLSLLLIYLQAKD